jgi:hypothetical protein
MNPIKAKPITAAPTINLIVFIVISFHLITCYFKPTVLNISNSVPTKPICDKFIFTVCFQ